MITKKQFCQMMIDNYCEEENIEKVSDVDVFKSSVIAVCMEYLGLIKSKESKRYTMERGGILYSYIDKEAKECNILSARELIDLLPESK